jgi:zinc protease
MPDAKGPQEFPMTFRSCMMQAFLLLVFLPLAPARAEDPALKKVTTVEGITEYKLANGLRVLLFPDASKPLVTVNLTHFVGSRHEGYGEAGMAHLLEHMLFKGCRAFPGSTAIPKALRDHGATFNGTTWVDRTNYYETMPASDANLEFALRLEADRMVNSFIRREDLLSEMTVVRSEFEMGENSPDRILSQRVMAVAYEWHNYGKNTIGNRTDIERVPVDRLQAFYKKYYRPDNALLVVAGKFDEKKALALVQKLFGVLKNPAAPLEKTYTEEPVQDGERTVTLRRAGSLGAVNVVYHIPAGAHPDYPAIDVLEDVLTSAPNGRLYKALVKSKLASKVGGNASAWHDPGVLEITATVEADKLTAARQAITDTLENLAKTPVTAEEVARAQAKYKKYYDQLLAESDSLAVRLSEWAACGDWRLFFLHRDRLAAATAADVNRVAAKYLVPSNRTAGVFIPTKSPLRAKVPATPRVAALVEGYKGKAQVAAGEAFDPTPQNIEKRVKRSVLAGGVKAAFLAKKTRGEMVNLRLSLRFGNAKSLAGKATAADLLGPLMRRGTQKHNRQQLQDALDRLGAQLSVSSSAKGILGVGLQVKRANLPAALDLLEEVLRQPSFPAEEFDVLKRESVARLEKGKTEPIPLAIKALQRTLAVYPKDDVRYVPTIAEDVERHRAVTLEDVKGVYAAQLGGTVGELAVVGDFDPEATASRFSAMLKNWKAPVAYQRVPRPAATNVKGGTQTIITPDKANAVFVAGLVFPATDADPDYPALEIGNYLLGEAPLASRLSNRVRGKQGLSYTVGSHVNAHPIDRDGQFMVFAVTNPANMGKVDAAVKDEIQKFLDLGPTSEELKEGKRAYLQQQKVALSDDETLAQELSTNLFVGRTFAFQAAQERKIQSLDPGDVQNALKKYVVPAKLVIIKAGDLPKK